VQWTVARRTAKGNLREPQNYMSEFRPPRSSNLFGRWWRKASVRAAKSRLCALALLLAAGCSGAPTAFAPPIALDRTKGRQSIGVISAVGSKFAVQTVGTTVFGNESNSVQVANWSIDDLVANKIAGLLGDSADVRRITYAKDAFAAYDAPGGLFRDHNAELKEILRKLTATQKSDVYLVVIASSSYFGSTNQSVGGLGIVQAGNIFVNKRWLHALFQIRVYDGRTLEFLGWKPATIGQDTFMATIKGPHREVDASWWPTPATVEGDRRLKTAVRELVEQALTTTLPEVLSLEQLRRAG
jgi:hypothetical protein